MIPIDRNGRLEEVYWTFSFSPVYGDTGAIAGVFVTCTETTKAVLGRQKVDQTQRQVLASFEELPVGHCHHQYREPHVPDGQPLLWSSGRAGHLVWRAPEEIVDKPLLEALPELAGQWFDQWLQAVIDTGQPYIATEVAVDVVRQGRLQTIYVDLTYQS